MLNDVRINESGHNPPRNLCGTWSSGFSFPESKASTGCSSYSHGTSEYPKRSASLIAALLWLQKTVQRLLPWNYCLRLNFKTDLHYFKASQQKASAEVSTVDAPVYSCRAFLDTKSSQRLCQVLVAPSAVTHSPLEQHTRFKSPIFSRPGFGYFCVWLIRQRNRPAWFVHLQIQLHPVTRSRCQLESILAQVDLCSLYLCPYIAEARNA